MSLPPTPRMIVERGEAIGLRILCSQQLVDRRDKCIVRGDGGGLHNQRKKISPMRSDALDWIFLYVWLISKEENNFSNRTFHLVASSHQLFPWYL